MDGVHKIHSKPNDMANALKPWMGTLISEKSRNTPKN